MFNMQRRNNNKTKATYAQCAAKAKQRMLNMLVVQAHYKASMRGGKKNTKKQKNKNT